MNGNETSRVINEIMNSKTFPQAATAFVEQFLQVFTSYKYIVKLQSDEGRYVVSLQQCAYLFDPQSESELTASALHNFAIENQLSTKSRVSAILALSVMGRYLLWEPSSNDKRMKIFTPTERYMQMAKESYLYYALPMSIIDPEKFGSLVEFDPKLVGRISRVSVQLYLSEMRIAQTIRSMHLISYRDGGYEVFMRILREAQYFTPARNNIIALPFAMIARELSISRSQVQKLVKSLADVGLLTLHDDGGKQIELMPSMQAFATEIIASMLGIFANAAMIVLNDKK